MTPDPLAMAIAFSELADEDRVLLFGAALALRDGRPDFPRDAIVDDDRQRVDSWLIANGYATRARAALAEASA